MAKMSEKAIKIRDKWISEDSELMAKFSRDKEAVNIINALAVVVSDYKSKKNS